MYRETGARGAQGEVWVEAGKEGQVRSVSCEGPETCTRTKGRSEGIGPGPPAVQANTLERKTAEAAGPEVPGQEDLRQLLPLTGPSARWVPATTGLLPGYLGPVSWQ